MMFDILYPEKQTVSEKTVKEWAADEVADATGKDCDPKMLDIQDAILILEDSGTITFAR